MMLSEIPFATRLVRFDRKRLAYSDARMAIATASEPPIAMARTL